MAKGININSKEWCDLVFKGRNKSYGAYRMRQTSAKRHIFSFVIVVLALFVSIAIPSIIERIEFYLFQHSDANYVIEDYKYISENLTEVELQQLSKQYIPNPAKPKVKVISKVEKVLAAQKAKNLIPVIVDDNQLNDIPEDLLENDSLQADEPTREETAAETEPDSNLYTIVEVMPAFPGGESGLMEFVYKNLRYPIEAINKKIENCVICSFIIDTNGLVTQVEVTQPAHPLLDKEALRIVRSLPKWKPARQHGKPIRVKYTLPIVFRLK